MNRHEYPVIDLTMKIHAQLTGSGSHFFSNQDLGAAVVWLQWRTMEGQGWQTPSTTSSEFDGCVQKLAHAVLTMYTRHLCAQELRKVDNVIAAGGPATKAEVLSNPNNLLEQDIRDASFISVEGGIAVQLEKPLEQAFDVTKELDGIRSTIIAGLAVPPELLRSEVHPPTAHEGSQAAANKRLLMRDINDALIGTEVVTVKPRRDWYGWHPGEDPHFLRVLLLTDAGIVVELPGGGRATVPFNIVEATFGSPQFIGKFPTPEWDK